MTLEQIEKASDLYVERNSVFHEGGRYSHYDVAQAFEEGAVWALKQYQKEIDDRRRYEIAKQMLPNTAYMDGNQYGGRFSPEQAAQQAVAYADALICELSKEKKK